MCPTNSIVTKKVTNSNPLPIKEKSPVSVSQFLAPLYPNENERLWLTFIEPKDKPLADGEQRHCKFFDTSRRKIATSKFVRNKIRKMNMDHGVYFRVNAGGNSDKEIVSFNAVFVERDDISIPDQHALLDQSPIPTSIRVETRKSVHAYWLLETGCNEQQWREATARLIQFFKSDKQVSRPCQLMRLPFLDHISFGNEPKKVLCVEFEPERRYSIEQILEAYPAIEQTPTVGKFVARSTVSPDADPFAGRAAALKQYVVEHGRYYKTNNSYSMRCPGHNSKGNSSLFFLPDSGAIACHVCGTNLDDVCQALNLPFFNSNAQQYFYQKGANV